MLPEWRRLIEAIHSLPVKCVVVVTGGGSSAISDLLTVPGGSRTILEAIVPYTSAALTEWLGRTPEQFCSAETARAMATIACERAQRLSATDESNSRGEDGLRFLGVGCTSSLVSDRPKKGPHRIHVAVETDEATHGVELVLEKGARDRSGEEQLAGQLLLMALARAAGVGECPPLELLPSESIEERYAAGNPLMVALRRGSISHVWSLPDWRLVDELPPSGGAGVPQGVLCGAFNPLHFGHEQLRRAAEAHLGQPVCFEISLRNVDKPPLDYLTIEERRQQFSNAPLVLTSAPTFAEKSTALPGMTFVVGVDTAERIIQSRYYGGGDEATRHALETVAANRCRFLVAGRKVGDRFMTLADLPVPAEFASLFEELPAREFRADVSSTELRKQQPDA